MKAVNCKSVWLEIEASDPGREPDNRTKEHLQTCTGCQLAFEKELKLRRLVGSLGTVPAPPDFDFRLRARLATERSAKKSWALGGMSLVSPSLALATVVLLLGAVFLVRSLNTPSDDQVTTVQKDNGAKQATPGAVSDAQPIVPEVGAGDTARNLTSGVIRKPSKRTRSHQGSSIAGNSVTTSKDFSNTAAEVVQRTETREQTGFPIDGSSDSLKLSLDDEAGISRTISLPRVSFGSQQLVAGESPVLVKTSAKGVW